MFPTDYLDGSFDSFETTVTKGADGFYYAEALGIKGKGVDAEQAISEMNNELLSKMERGELVPQTGN
jgi:hypothetical protein